MANEDDKRAEQEKKAQAEAQRKVQEEKGPPPTQDELNNELERMVKEAEATGHRDDPAILRVRGMLDRREGGKDASKKG